MLDPDDVGEDVAATANSAVGFGIVGDDPVAAGRAVDLAAAAGRHVFDIPAARVNHAKDSGWRVLAGDESDEEIDDPQDIALLPLRVLVAAEAGLEPLLRTPAPAAFHREPNGEFVPAEPPQSWD